MHNDSEQPENAQSEENKDNPQSFSPEELKGLSSDQPEDFELSDSELSEISGGPNGHNWFRLKQEVPKQLDGKGRNT
jgi:bacteriocin-like protein